MPRKSCCGKLVPACSQETARPTFDLLSETALPLEGIPLITPISTSACFRRKMRGRAGVVDAANVVYAGVSPGTAGLYQSNIRVSAGLADGYYPISLRLGGFVTPSGGYITVKN